MRGESQKPVSDAYRNNWDDIFGKRKDKENNLPPKSKRPQPDKAEACSECFPGKPGKHLIDADGAACFSPCPRT